LEGPNDDDVATILDASSEKLSLVLPRTMGATSAGIADLTRRELLRPKDFALLRYFGRNRLGFGNSRKQQGGSRDKTSKGSAANSPITTHGRTPHLFAAITWNMPKDSAISGGEGSRWRLTAAIYSGQSIRPTIGKLFGSSQITGEKPLKVKRLWEND
jgi:hypothetical protein